MTKASMELNDRPAKILAEIRTTIHRILNKVDTVHEDEEDPSDILFSCFCHLERTEQLLNNMCRQDTQDDNYTEEFIRFSDEHADDPPKSRTADEREAFLKELRASIQHAIILRDRIRDRAAHAAKKAFGNEIDRDVLVRRYGDGHQITFNRGHIHMGLDDLYITRIIADILRRLDLDL